jgi:hypothetical protein
VDMQHRYDIKKSHFDGEWVVLCRLCDTLHTIQQPMFRTDCCSYYNTSAQPPVHIMSLRW